MKTTGQTLQQLAMELDRQQQAKRDIITKTNNVAFMGNQFEIYIPKTDQLERFDITQHTHGQIANKLDIPKKYYNKMQDKAPELLNHSVNYWFNNNPTRNLIRTLDGNARAFLSDRYRRIDNYEIAENTLPIIQQAELELKSHALTDNNFYLKAVFPKIQGEVRPGDIIQSGIVIKNSEIGLSRFVVCHLMYRLVCENGMIREDIGMNQYHLGAKVLNDDPYGLISDATRQKEDIALLSKMRDIVKGLISQETFDIILNEQREAAGIPIEKSPDKVIEVLETNHGIRKEEGSSILTHLASGGDLTKYGLANAITLASQSIENYDRATELETLGGKIISMKKSDWSLIADKVA